MCNLYEKAIQERGARVKMQVYEDSDFFDNGFPSFFFT